MVSLIRGTSNIVTNDAAQTGCANRNVWVIELQNPDVTTR
jgi:hypothetical protein